MIIGRQCPTPRLPHRIGNELQISLSHTFSLFLTPYYFSRTSLNGSDRVRTDKSPGCPTSSSDGGTSAISPCPPHSSPSPRLANTTVSDSRNQPQIDHPVPDQSVTTDPHTSHSDSTKQPQPYVPLDTPEMLKFVDPQLAVQFQHPVADTLETEVFIFAFTYIHLKFRFHL